MRLSKFLGFFWDLLVLYFALFGFIEGPRITRDLSIFMYLFIELLFIFLWGGGSSVEKLMIFCLQCVVLYYGGVTRSDREQLLLTFLLYL